MKKTSLSDIAEALSVSKSLVSLVLNNKGDQHGISKKTQENVKQMASSLNYSPNSMARSLRTGKTDTIGLIIADIANPFFAKLARSIEDYAFTKGYHLIFSSSDESEELEVKLIKMMQNRQTDGLIISSTLVKENSKVLELLQKNDFPFVLIDRYIPDTNFSYVVSDNEKGSEILTQHIIDQGRKRIALFTLTPSHLTSISDRIKGYKTALKKNNIEVDESLIIEIPFDDIDQVETVFDSMSKQNVDAIVTLNNSLAFVCLKECKKRNISIPKDIAFASFDNVSWFELTEPNITGVKQPITEMGKKAVEILIQKLEGKVTSENQLQLPVELILRGSSQL